MTLLRDIQDAAVGGTDPITTLLRRCKILAARLRSAEFGQWVERELNGYATVGELPKYRILTVRSLGHFAGPFGSGLQNAPIPRFTIPKEYRDWVDVSNLMEPIGAYEDLLRSDKSASFQRPWLADLVALVGQQIHEGMNCVGAWQELPRGAIVALLDTVRNKVLSFALDIERLSPDAGEAMPGSPALAPDRVQQVFQTNIYGNVGNVATGGTGAQQSIGAMVTQGDFSSLAQNLRNLGIAEAEIEDLKSAIEGDTKAGKPVLGRRIGEWCGKMLGRAGEGALKVTVDVAATVLPKLISGYLGLPK